MLDQTRVKTDALTPVIFMFVVYYYILYHGLAVRQRGKAYSTRRMDIKLTFDSSFPIIIRKVK